jgi:hypothetical protein
VEVRIVQVDAGRPYEGITDADAVADGLASRSRLDDDLRRFYGEIDPSQPMTRIWFALQTAYVQTSLE